MKPIGRVITNKNKLLRCPFCGGRAETVRWHEGSGETVFIRCETCRCATEQIHITPFVSDEEEAVAVATKTWNRRTVR